MSLTDQKTNGKKGCAVIGYGGMGGWHTRHLLESDVAYLTGIYDIKPERAELARENGIYAYPSYEAVLVDPKVDFVTIAVPNELHAPLAIQALRAGKHVISEKPVTLSINELDSVIKVADECGKLFTVHQNRRFDVDYLMMKQVYASGVLGDVFGVESRYQGSRGIPGDWRGHKEHGGGMLYDWGIHLIDQMLGIVYDRKIESIFCRLEHITNDEVDDGFKLDLYFEGGLDARIEVGTSHFISLPRFYMTGRRGTAEVNDWRDRTRIVTCREWHEDDVKPVVTSAGLTKTMAPRDEKTVDESWLDRPESDVHDFYRNFTRAMDGKEPQLVSHEQMRRDLEIIEAAFESDKQGRIIPFDDRHFGK